ncbi:MAG: enoyl-CoA hydratase/isomerase family protein [Dehalococcoidia bacterium]|nr:enoyl-CoA hydratase/isomerase family protein [Dehalococcoidia bacterium]
MLSKSGSVATVTLNRPNVINAFNVQMRDDLYAALEAVRDDSEVKAVLITGAGDRGFCAGADLTEFGTAPSQTIARQVRWERDLWGLFLSISKPLVAALHGYIIGSGVEIACLCDIRIAADNAVFRMPESASQTLPRTIGVTASMEILLTNDVISASRALEIGLVHKLVSRDSLDASAADAADDLASLPSDSIAAVKRAVLEGMDFDLERGLDLELRLARILMRRQPVGK